MIPVSLVHDPIPLVATVNCVSGWHRDDYLPTKVIASLLRGRKMLLFGSKGYRKAAQLPSVWEANNFENFFEGVIYKQTRSLAYCVEEVGDTVCLPARTAHLVLTLGPNESWNVLLSHNVSHSSAVAARLEMKCWYVTQGAKSVSIRNYVENGGASMERGLVLENIGPFPSNSVSLLFVPNDG